MSLEQQIVETLTQRRQTIGLCESLTAGLASATLANVPGASSCLRGALVTYATDLKATLAGVDEGLLAERGPVDAETARQMALGTKRVLRTDWGLSLTGVAGPTQQNGHPVGEVFIGVAAPNGEAWSLRAAKEGAMKFELSEHSDTPVEVLLGDRPAIRALAVECAFDALLAALVQESAKNDD